MPAGADGARLPTEPPLGIVSPESGGRSYFARLDPLTLAVREPSIEIPEWHGSWSLSPDGRRIAIGKSAGGPSMGRAVVIADPRRIRLLGYLQATNPVEEVAWLTPRRLVGIVGDSSFIRADPLRLDVLQSGVLRPAGGCRTAPSTFSTRRAVVSLQAHRIFAIDARGRVRVASLRGLPGDCDSPGLATDRAGRHAFVVSDGSGLTRVDLRTMRVATVALAGRRPSSGVDSRALWLGHRRIAAAHLTRRDRAAGVELIDLRRRTRRTIAAHAGAVRRARGRLLLYDGAGHGRRFGLGVFSLRGRERFRVLGGRHIWNVQVWGRFAYASGPRGLAIVDLRSGRVVRRTRSGPDEFEFVKRGA